MAEIAVRARWRPWQWAAWLAATVAAVAAFALVSMFVYEFIDVCGPVDDPIASEVHELQAVLAGLVVFPAVCWFAAARLTGRWWRLAALSAVATAAVPATLLLTHLSVASWAQVGFCMM